jgi:uncharacterized RDD family membrane protein YckC
MTTQSEPQIDLNHWLYRFIAWVIDSIIIGIPVWLIWTFAIWSIIFSGGALWLLGFGSWLFLPLLFGLIEVLYFVFLDVSWGATIGKRVMGLKVQMTDGGKVNFGKAFIRNISKIYPLFLFLDWIIGLATPGADRRQKYSDRMAGTTVVATKQPFASAPTTQSTTQSP